jgi:hypothetical protein
MVSRRLGDLSCKKNATDRRLLVGSLQRPDLVITVAGAPCGLPARAPSPTPRRCCRSTASSLNDGQRCWENITTVSHVGLEVL